MCLLFAGKFPGPTFFIRVQLIPQDKGCGGGGAMVKGCTPVWWLYISGIWLRCSYNLFDPALGIADNKVAGQELFLAQVLIWGFELRTTCFTRQAFEISALFFQVLKQDIFYVPFNDLFLAKEFGGGRAGDQTHELIHPRHSTELPKYLLINTIWVLCIFNSYL